MGKITSVIEEPGPSTVKLLLLAKHSHRDSANRNLALTRPGALTLQLPNLWPRLLHNPALSSLTPVSFPHQGASGVQPGCQRINKLKTVTWTLGLENLSLSLS